MLIFNQDPLCCQTYKSQNMFQPCNYFYQPKPTITSKNEIKFDNLSSLKHMVIGINCLPLLSCLLPLYTHISISIILPKRCQTSLPWARSSCLSENGTFPVGMLPVCLKSPVGLSQWIRALCPVLSPMDLGYLLGNTVNLIEVVAKKTLRQLTRNFLILLLTCRYVKEENLWHFLLFWGMTSSFPISRSPSSMLKWTYLHTFFICCR